MCPLRHIVQRTGNQSQRLQTVKSLFKIQHYIAYIVTISKSISLYTLYDRVRMYDYECMGRWPLQRRRRRVERIAKHISATA